MDSEVKNPEEIQEEVKGIIEPVEIDHEMRTAYIDYSMSVIVSRALPDARDGLKPVQRRVLFGMDGLGLSYGGQTKKSARIVGEVLGKFHPHGDSSVYDAMARLAQPWNQRYPLVFGQGNFGSMDGDPVAAMRYTEAKLEKMTEDVLADLDKDTVDMTLNFDDSLQEPTVLPTKFPLLLLNGSSGIAVGMATNMAPHNLGEVCDAICAYIDDPEITTEGLMQYIQGPDFPTGGIIMGRQGIIDAYNTGRGRVVIRAKTEIEESDNGRETIVVTEVPYMVNKADMLSRISEMVHEKKIEGIADIRELTNREGIRIEFVVKKEANANVVLNTLFKYTALQSSFSINNVALVNGRPQGHAEDLRGLPPRGGGPQDPLRPGESPQARPHPRRPAQGDRRDRRDHRDHPLFPQCGRGQGEDDGSLRIRRHPGIRHRGNAPASADRTRKGETPGRV